MKLLSRIDRYLTTSQGRVSFILVLAYALVLALFVGRAFVFPLPAQYQLDFGKARWIQQPKAALERAAYFRKELYISGAVDHSWIQVSATGIYTLYVNSAFVGRKKYPGARPSGVYDLTSLLVPGKNTIAIYIEPGNFPGPGQIMVRGAYSLAGAPSQVFYSDSSWKVASTPDGVVGSQSWSSRFLDDTHWTNARETFAQEYLSTVQPVAFDPALFKKRLRARWIGAREGQAQEVSFTYYLELPLLRGETWLQVAANGDYDLIINGWLIATQAAAPQITGSRVPTLNGLQIAANDAQVPAITSPNSGLPGADSPTAVFGYRNVFNRAPISAFARLALREPALVSPQAFKASRLVTHPNTSWSAPDFPSITPRSIPPLPRLRKATPLIAYNISSWLKSGTNSIVVHVRSESGPALLLGDGRTHSSNGQTRTFETDESWRTSCPASHAATPRLTRAVVVGNYGAQPWGLLPRVISTPGSVPGSLIGTIVGWAAVTGAVTLVVMMLWLLPATRRHHVDETCFAHFLTRDALRHLPALSLLVLLWLLSYDVRLASDFCFSPGLVGFAVGLLMTGKLLGLAGSAPVTIGSSNGSPHDDSMPRRWWLLALGLIVVVGFAVRAHGLVESSLGHDEAGMARFSQGVLKIGYPYIITGSFTKWQTSYLLVPYPLALVSLLLGPTVSAYRLPALIFGTLTIGLIGWAGNRMFDQRVGLLAALIYGFLSGPIAWARDGFYPAQESFFALLTFWLFYEAIRDDNILDYRYLTASTVTFLLTYLSWAGSGFILPSLFTAFLVTRWGRSDWIRDRRLWYSALAASAVVILQLCAHQILMIPGYLGINFDLSEVSTPSPVFLDRLLFVPFYYLEQLFLAENHTVLSLVAACGLFCVRRDQGLRYVLIVLIALEVCYTLFLPVYAPRYSFHAQPLLVLAAAAVTLQIIDALARVGAEVHEQYLLRASQRASLWLLLALVPLSANAYVLKAYRLGFDPSSPAWFERMGIAFKPNYRDADLYVASHAQPGDAVITRQPHVFAFYTGRSADYSTDMLANRRVFYDGGAKPPRYIDRWWGLPTLRGVEELLDVTSAHQRIWILMSNRRMVEYDPETYMFLLRWGRVVFQTSHQQVVLLTGVAPSLARAADQVERSHAVTSSGQDTSRTRALVVNVARTPG
jgi:hypothetical protein